MITHILHFLNQNNKIDKPDKWNPADMWVMTPKGLANLKDMNSKVMSRSKNSLEFANQFFADQFTHRDIIPVSLKKPQSSPHRDS